MVPVKVEENSTTVIPTSRSPPILTWKAILLLFVSILALVAALSIGRFIYLDYVYMIFGGMWTGMAIFMGLVIRVILIGFFLLFVVCWVYYRKPSFPGQGFHTPERRTPVRLLSAPHSKCGHRPFPVLSILLVLGMVLSGLSVLPWTAPSTPSGALVLVLHTKTPSAHSLSPVPLTSGTTVHERYTAPQKKSGGDGIMDMAFPSVSNPGANFSLALANRSLFVGNYTSTDGGTPVGIAYDPVNGYVYTADTEMGAVSVVNPGTDRVLYTVQIGPGYHFSHVEDVLYDPLDGNIYATYLDALGHGYLAQINTTTQTLKQAWALPSSAPVALVSGAPFPIPAEAFVPGNDTLYIALGQVLDAFRLDLQKVTATLPVVPSNVTGGFVTAVTYDSGDGNVYVSLTNETYFGENGTYNAVAQIDPSSLGVTAYLPVGQFPDGLAYDPSSGELLVANAGSGNVTAFATVALGGITYQPVTSIPVGGNPVGMAVDPQDQEIYLANPGLDALQNLSGKSNSVLGTIPGLEVPAQLAFTPSGSILYVTNLRYLTTVDVPRANITSRLPLGFYDNALTYVPSTGVLYSSSGSYTRVVDAIDPRNLSVANETPFAPPFVSARYYSNATALVYDPLGPSLVALEGTNVTALSLPGLVPRQTLTFPDLIVSGAFDPQDGILYLASTGNNITAVNASTLTVVSQFSVGNYNLSLTAFGLDPTRGLLFVSTLNVSSGGANLTVYNATTFTQISKVPLPGIPDGFALNAANGTVFVSNLGDDNVSALVNVGGGSFVAARIDVGMPTRAILYDPQDGEVYAAGSQQAQIAVFHASPLRQVKNYSLSGVPGSLALDTVDEYLFVGTRLPHSTIAALSVGPNPLAVHSFTATPDPVVLGTSTTLTVMPVGGTGPLNYTYTGLPPGCASTDAPTLTCAPATVGNFSVQVTVRDSTGGTTHATLSLTVIWPLPPIIRSFYAWPDPTVVDQPTILSVLATGGVGALSYAYSGLPPSAATCPDLNTTLLSCVPLASGNYSVTVTVTDQVGRASRSILPLRIGCLGPVAGPHICAVDASPEPVTIGNRTVLTVNATGGNGPLTYQYSRLPPSSASCPDLNLSQLPCIPLAAGAYSVQVSVTDRNASTATATLPLVVDCVGSVPGPRICSFQASPDQLPVGSNTTLSTLVNDSVLPITYRYSGLPAAWTGCAGGNVSSFPCIPSSNGTYQVQVTVVDGNSRVASASLPLYVGCAGKPAGPEICSVLADPVPVIAGDPLTITVEPTSAGGPLSYSFRNLPGGCVSADRPSLSCRPAAAGRFVTVVTVTDASGQTAEANLTVLVVPAGTPAPVNPTPTAPSPWLDLLLATLGGAALGVLLVLIFVFAKKKEKKKVGKPPKPAQKSEGSSPVSDRPPETIQLKSEVQPPKDGSPPSSPTAEEWKVIPP